MKNKKFIWLIGPVVLVIWGVIGFQVYSAINGKQVVEVQSTITPFKQEIKSTADKYQLQLNYEDPFLKNNKPVYKPPVQTTVKKNKVVVKKTVKKIPKPPLQWPVVKYHGLINNTGDSRVTYLLDVNGSSLFFSVGDTHQELLLLKAWPDSVKLEYKKEEKKTFSKSL